MKNEIHNKEYHTEEESLITDAYLKYDLDGDSPYNIHIEIADDFSMKLEGEAQTFFYNYIKFGME